MISTMNSAASKPFAKKTFYLDLKNFPNQAKLSADLKLLGAKEETSLIKSVSFVVSNRVSLKPQFQAPCAPLSNSRSMSPHLFHDSPIDSPAPAGSPMWEPSPRIMSRNMLILQQAAKKQGGTTDVTEICKMWNIKIYPLQKVLSWVEKYKNLYYKKHIAEQKKHLKKLPKASESTQKLQAPFIKIEDAERKCKTRYRVFSSWKNIIDPSLSQFVGQLRRNSKMFGSINDSVRPALKEVDVKSFHSSNLISTNRTVSISKMSACTVSNLISACAANDGAKENDCCSPRKRKEKEAKKKSKKRYCEICDVYYSDLENHLDKKSHEKYLNNEKHFSVVQDVISDLPQASDFISSLVQNEAKQKEKTPDYLFEDISGSVLQFETYTENESPLYEEDENCMTELYSVNPNDYVSASCSSADTTPFPFLEYMHNSSVKNPGYEDMKAPTLVYYNTIENTPCVFTPQKFERKPHVLQFNASEKDAFEMVDTSLVKGFYNKENDSEFCNIKTERPESNYGSGSNSCDTQIAENKIQGSVHIENLLPVMANDNFANSHMMSILNNTVNEQNLAQLADEDVADSVIESVPMCEDENSDYNLNSTEQNAENEPCADLDVAQPKDSVLKNRDGACVSTAEYGVQNISINSLLTPASNSNLVCNNVSDAYFTKLDVKNGPVEPLADCKISELKLSNSETKISAGNCSLGDELQIQPLAESDASKFGTEIYHESNKEILPSAVSQPLSEKNTTENVIAEDLTGHNEKNEDFNGLSNENYTNGLIAKSKDLSSSFVNEESKSEVLNANSYIEKSHISCNFATCETIIADDITSNFNPEIQNSEAVDSKIESKNCKAAPEECQHFISEQSSVTKMSSLGPLYINDIKYVETGNLIDEMDLSKPNVNFPSKDAVIIQSDTICKEFIEDPFSSNDVNSYSKEGNGKSNDGNSCSNGGNEIFIDANFCSEEGNENSTSVNSDSKGNENIASCLDLSHQKSLENHLQSESGLLNFQKYSMAEIDSVVQFPTKNSENFGTVDMKNEIDLPLPNYFPGVNLPPKNTVIVQSENSNKQSSENRLSSENVNSYIENKVELNVGSNAESYLDLSTRRHENLTDSNIILLNSVGEAISKATDKVSEVSNNTVHSTVTCSDEALNCAKIQVVASDAHACESEGHLQCSSISSSTFKNCVEMNISVLNENANLIPQYLSNENTSISNMSINPELNLTCKPLVIKTIREVSEVNLHQTSGLSIGMEQNNINSLLNANNAINFCGGYKQSDGSSHKAPKTLSFQEERQQNLFADVSTKYEFIKQPISFEKFVDKMQVSLNAASDMWNSGEVFYVLDETIDDDDCGEMEHSANDKSVVTSLTVPHHMEGFSGVQTAFTESVSCSMEYVMNIQPVDVSTEAVSIAIQCNSSDAQSTRNSINNINEYSFGFSGDNSSSTCSPTTTFDQSVVLPSTNVIQDTQRTVHIVYLNSPSQIQKQENEKNTVNCENHILPPQSLSIFNSSSSSCKRRLSFNQSDEADFSSSPEKDNIWASIHHEVDSICKSIDSDEDCPLNLSMSSDKHDHSTLLIQN